MGVLGARLVLLVAVLTCTACAATSDRAGPATTTAGTPSVTASPATSPSPVATPSLTPTGSPPTTTSRSPAPAAVAGSALEALALLPVRGRAPRTGYSRAQFGQAWSDVDRNGCDTRNDVLRRDLTRTVLKPGTRGCVVLSGSLLDPYTGDPVAFLRGAVSSRAVQVDHVVALSDAWQKGAQRLSAARRTQLANDPLELLAVSAVVNAAKGDSDAASWLPPRRSYRCAFVARQIAVKRAYALWVTAAERDAMARVLAGCPGQALPSG